MRAALFLLALCLWPIGVMGQPTPGFGAGSGNASASGYAPDDGANWTDPDPTTVAAALDDLATAIAAIVAGAVGDLGDLTYTPAVAADWDGDADPGNADDAVDQLAERMDDNEGVIAGLGALATGDDAGDILYTCAVDANWTGGLCPGTPALALDDAAARIATLEGATVDAANVTFTPTTVGDWTGDADPGNTDDALDDLAGRVETLEGAGGGAADAVTKSISQAAHGLSVGDWVRLSGGSYVEAQANSAANAEVVGVVSAVDDVNTFTLQVAGRVTGLSGLTANAVHYLDASTAGAITATEPTGSNVSKPVLIADSTTSGWVLQMRGTLSQASGDWDWTQAVGSPTVSDWTDANAAGADVALATLADGSYGDYVVMVPGASTTDNYGATTPIGAGNFTWCVRLSTTKPDVTSHGLAVTGSVYAAFVDGTNVDTADWYGVGLVYLSDDYASALLYAATSNGGGTDEWDSTVSTVATNAYTSSGLDACFVRSTTTLTVYIAPYLGGGWIKAQSQTVSADAGLMAIIIDAGDAYSHRAVVYAYGDPGGVPGTE